MVGVRHEPQGGHFSTFTVPLRRPCFKEEPPFSHCIVPPVLTGASARAINDGITEWERDRLLV